MGIIKRGIKITRTIRNAARFREIISIFARNGLDEFILRARLHRFAPSIMLPSSRIEKAIEGLGEVSWGTIIGYRLRRSFEELGPSFIKIGQLLSTREDIFPSGFIEQMKYLRDSVQGIPFGDAMESLNKSLGRDYHEVFDFIEEEPIGTASIGLVYRAKLKGGDSVVVKIRRPGIKKIISMDIAIIKVIVEKLETTSEQVRYLGLSKLVRDFGNSLQSELDFQREALNCNRQRKSLLASSNKDSFHIPKVYEEFTCEDVLVLEELRGVKFSDLEKRKEINKEIKDRMLDGFNLFIRNILVDGFFHADLHSGNFFLLEDGRIGIVDFGLVGFLGKKSRVNLIGILYFMITHNYENLTYEFLEVAEYEGVPDIDKLVIDLRESLSPFMGLSSSQIDPSLLFTKIFKILSGNKIYLPSDWFVVFRALITLDGVGRSLGVDVDILSLIEKNLKSIIERHSPFVICRRWGSYGKRFFFFSSGFSQECSSFYERFFKK